MFIGDHLRANLYELNLEKVFEEDAFGADDVYFIEELIFGRACVDSLKDQFFVVGREAFKSLRRFTFAALVFGNTRLFVLLLHRVLLDVPT